MAESASVRKSWSAFWSVYEHRFGIWGVAGPAALLIVVSLLLANLPSASAEDVVIALVLVGALFVAPATLAIWISTHRYPRSTRSSAFERFSATVLKSKVEFCLLLRPFGRDAQVHVPGRGIGPQVYLGQVIAGAAAGARGLQTYALVDSRELLAIPGPVPVSVDGYRWQTCAAELIDSAHTVVMLLTAVDRLEAGFAWEVGYLSRRGLAHRTVIVIPPLPFTSPSYRACVEQAARIVVTLLESSETLAGAESPSVREWTRFLLDSFTLIISLVRDDPGPDSAISVRRHHYLNAEGVASSEVHAENYERTLIGVIRTIDRSLAESPSESRYPNRPRGGGRAP